MYHVQVQLFIFLLMLAEALVVVTCISLASTLCHFLGRPLQPAGTGLYLGLAAYMVLVCNFFMLKFGLYSERRPRTLRLSLVKIASAVALSIVILGFTLYAVNVPQIGGLFLLICGLCLFVCLGLVRLLVEYGLTRQLTGRFHSRRILIVGSDRRADMIAKLLSNQRSWGHRLVGFVTETPETPAVVYGLPQLGSLPQLEDILIKEVVDEVFFALPDYSHDISKQLAACERLGVTYYIVPAMYDPTAPHKLMMDVIQGVPTLARVMVPFNPSGYIYKRVMDYALGLTGFLMFLLMYPVVAAAIKLDSPGPVLFTQSRGGRFGRVFTMYKFRTMCAQAEKQQKDLQDSNEMNGCIFKLRNDPRVTRVGSFLRRTSLDEFPQFINVLKGEMSIVGPRPHPVYEVNNYSNEHRRRLSMRPGLTGLWQISGRSDLKDVDQTMELDLAYIDNWRFWTDVRLVFKTLLVVLRGSGAH